MLTNYHTHSIFSYGKNTPEEIVQKAIEKGFGAVGFSDHAPTIYDLSYCMQDLMGYIIFFENNDVITNSKNDAADDLGGWNSDWFTQNNG